MTRNPARAMAYSAGLFVVLTLEQILFGRDTPGTAHDVSVAAWIVSLIAVAAFLAFFGIWVNSRLRNRRARTD